MSIWNLFQKRNAIEPEANSLQRQNATEHGTQSQEPDPPVQEGQESGGMYRGWCCQGNTSQISQISC